MTGPIDPLLGGAAREGAAAGRDQPVRANAGRAPAARTAGAAPVAGPAGPAAADDDGADLNEVYRRERPRLVRLAAVITLDHVLAEEVVQEGFSQVQRRAGATSDAVGALVRAVVQVAVDAVKQHGRGRLRRMLRVRARREFIAARRPVPVQPVGLAPEVAAAWSAIVGLPPRRRAIVGLQWCVGLADDQLAEAVVWPSAMVTAAAANTERRLRRALDLSGEALHRRLEDTFRAVGPFLAQSEPVTTARGGIRRAAPALWSATPAVPSGARVRVWSSIERRPSRARALAVTGAIGALAVGAVAWYSLSTGGGDGPSVSAPVDEQHAPVWYTAIEPLLPPGFDHVALIGVDSTAVTYLAIDLARGTSLDISIARRAGPTTVGSEVHVTCGILGRTDPKADVGPCTIAEAVAPSGDPTAASATGTAGAGTSAVTTPATVVRPLDPATIAATIAAGFDLAAVQSDLGADIEQSFGSPSLLRTVISRVDTVVARTVTGQVEVGRSSTYDGVVEVLEYARAAGRDPITTVTVVHGVYPPPPDRAGGLLAETDGVLAGWIVGADGRAFRVTTVASPRTDVAALEELLVDLTGVVATEVPTTEVPTTDTGTPGTGTPGTGTPGASSTTAG